MKDIATWARQVKCQEEIPAIFTAQFEEINFSDPDAFPLTIYLPPDKWGFHKTNAKLVCLLEDRLVIIEKLGRKIEKIVFCLTDINYLESVKLLLHSWLKIGGVSDQGAQTIVIDYNTVVANCFRPLMEKIRRNIYQLEADPVPEIFKQEQKKFEIYQFANYKFMNLATESILPTERVISQILQPEIKKKTWNYFDRIIVGTHLIILTSCELIIIQEHDPSWGSLTKYGCGWKYIPLNKIKNPRLLYPGSFTKKSRNKLEDNLINLQFNLAGDISVNMKYDGNQQFKLEQLFRYLKEPPICISQCS